MWTLTAVFVSGFSCSEKSVFIEWFYPYPTKKQDTVLTVIQTALILSLLVHNLLILLQTLLVQVYVQQLNFPTSSVSS